MTHVKVNAQDGSLIEFIYANPMSGAMKDVYWHPQQQYVVAFYKKMPDASGRERIKMIVEWSRQLISEDSGEECWKNVFCMPENIVEYDGKIGIVVPVFPPHFCFAKGTPREGMVKEGTWFTSAKHFNKGAGTDNFQFSFFV